MSAERASHAEVERKLGGGVICDRCGATLETYNEACTAALDDPCPGYQTVEKAYQGDRS